MKKLEWALWMAAQSDYNHEIWISRLLHRLLEGSSDVERLFRKTALGQGQIPEYIRAVRYFYRFSQTGDETPIHSAVDLSQAYPDRKSAIQNNNKNSGFGGGDDDSTVDRLWRVDFFDIYTPSFSQTVHSMSARRKNLRKRMAKSMK